MIILKGRIKIDPGINYLTNWRDSSGNLMINRFAHGKVIVNKTLTGCGFTTCCLINNINQIIVSPRLRLIQNKLEQHGNCYYFNREKDKNDKQVKGFFELEKEFTEYYNYCVSNNLPMKILVTFDSFSNLADMLEGTFKINISSTFSIAIDESHTLIKDVRTKECNNKGVLLKFLDRVFKYDNLLFISATPIVDYIQRIKEFKKNNVDYYELEWDNVIPINKKSFNCKSAVDAFDQIYKIYTKHVDTNGRNAFDAIFYGNGITEYSREAVIFLNSVSDIRKILNKYINKNNLIDAKDVSIICADTKENAVELRKTNSALKITKSIPKRGDMHPLWTFVTRTAFEGVDFYSTNASTYVIANYNVSSLSLDISTDIPQIIGRQRLPENHFRNTINIFYTNNKNMIDDYEFKESQKFKMTMSQKQIQLYDSATPECKSIALGNLNTFIEAHPSDLYISTVHGYPEIDDLLIVSEEYCRDILKNQENWFTQSFNNRTTTTYSIPAQQLIDDLKKISGGNGMREGIKTVYDYFQAYPECHKDFFEVLCNNGFGDIARYFNILPPSRVYASGFNTWKMNNEIISINMEDNVKKSVESTFEQGKVYTKQEIKIMLQKIYDNLGIDRKAKATDLEKYIKVCGAKKDGLKAFRIGES